MKGQISWDMLMIAGVVLIIFLFLFQVYTDRAQSVRTFEMQLAAQRVADGVGRTIDHSWLGGNGSVSHTILPETLPNGEPYNVSIRGRQVLVLYQSGVSGRVASYVTITSNVTAINFTMAPPAGSTMLNVTNSNGTVTVVG